MHKILTDYGNYTWKLKHDYKQIHDYADGSLPNNVTDEDQKLGKWLMAETDQKMGPFTRIMQSQTNSLARALRGEEMHG